MPTPTNALANPTNTEHLIMGGGVDGASFEVELCRHTSDDRAIVRVCDPRRSQWCRTSDEPPKALSPIEVRQILVEVLRAENERSRLTFTDACFDRVSLAIRQKLRELRVVEAVSFELTSSDKERRTHQLTVSAFDA